MVLWLMLFALVWAVKSMSWSAATKGSRIRFVFVAIAVSMRWSNGVVITKVSCTRPFLVGARVNVLRSSGSWSLIIGCPVSTLRKMWQARERLTSYRTFRLGSLGVTVLRGIVSYQTTI